MAHRVRVIYFDMSMNYSRLFIFIHNFKLSMGYPWAIHGISRLEELCREKGCKASPESAKSEKCFRHLQNNVRSETCDNMRGFRRGFTFFTFFIFEFIWQPLSCACCACCVRSDGWEEGGTHRPSKWP